jgi:hypothetical protein
MRGHCENSSHAVRFGDEPAELVTEMDGKLTYRLHRCLHPECGARITRKEWIRKVKS